MNSLKDKIIVALDVNNIKDAKKMACEVGPHVGAIKVGLEIMNSCGAPQVVNALKSAGANIFFDGKFKDIPNTVAGAVKAATKMGVWMMNVHATGGLAMMRAAKASAEQAAKEAGVSCPLLIAVTILTSLDVSAMQEIGLGIKSEDDLQQEVVRLARLTKLAGLDGVVASPKEIEAIRNACGPDFKIVTPGIRPKWAATGDQKRIMTPREAVKKGADYLVIGRPITRPPAEIGSPANAAKKIVEEL